MVVEAHLASAFGRVVRKNSTSKLNFKSPSDTLMRTISKGELVERLGSSGLALVNVLAPTKPPGGDIAYASYENIRIKGSVSIPRSELEAGRWRELDKSKEIVVHCSSYACQASRKAARFLEEKGFNVRAYEGGLKEWAQAGLPMEGKLTSREYLARIPKKSATAAR
jgi:rhodanese-related sulfurtransferase